ncbi:MAG TPA: zf-HC2 domain-containing protein [Syntrophomonadaceae bacterium]|nr:zf-HC2 domain-containing protein [Syntrophomonadaceae bacterium]
MNCNLESLQEYLDGEMDAPARRDLEMHLGQCRPCRREMSRMQLLWFELGQSREGNLPAELPYLRQQVINQALHSQREIRNSESNYWDVQKLAWQPAILGVSCVPGVGFISSVTRATGRQLPRLMSGTAALARRLVFPPQDKKGENK